MIIGPAIVLGLGQAAYIARMARSSLLEVVREDYVRTARAKGLNSRLVIAFHALPNALLPVITLSGRAARLRAGRLDPGGASLRHARARLRHVHGGQRARRVRHAEPRLSLCRRFRPAQYSGRYHHRLAWTRGYDCDDHHGARRGRHASAAARHRPRTLRRPPAGAARRRAFAASFVRRSPMSAFWGLVALGHRLHGGRRTGFGAIRSAQIELPRHDQGRPMPTTISAPIRSAATR